MKITLSWRYLKQSESLIWWITAHADFMTIKGLIDLKVSLET
jgi:hypothetical protein